MDKLILDLSNYDQKKVLQYLLMKNNQWTGISDIVLQNSSEQTRDRQIRRLINKQKNKAKKDTTDSMLIDIFKEHQGKILKTLMDDLNQSQRTELFM